MYTALGMSTVIFIIHGIVLYGYETQNARMSLDWMAVVALSNSIGTIAYATRVCIRDIQEC